MFGVLQTKKIEKKNFRHDFRPDYIELKQLRKNYPGVPFMVNLNFISIKKPCLNVIRQKV